MNAEEYNRKLLDNHDYLSDLGIEITDQGTGAATLSLPYAESIRNPGSEAIHGGAVATLIDHAGGVAIRTTIDDPDETPHATTDLNVTYVRPAVGDLTADATVIRSGRTMGTVAVEVSARTSEGEKTVAVGRLSIHMVREQ
ncbi:PaaI family thioesterase [Natronorubrum sp. FCH18a]|uniref:PaaI family thioesterase n=1 Tax=Natronorubrum sp. FCH18a TaxID=3447018 RepID=UPI003F51A15F